MVFRNPKSSPLWAKDCPRLAPRKGLSLVCPPSLCCLWLTPPNRIHTSTTVLDTSKPASEATSNSIKATNNSTKATPSAPKASTTEGMNPSLPVFFCHFNLICTITVTVTSLDLRVGKIVEVDRLPGSDKYVTNKWTKKWIEHLHPAYILRKLT